MRLGQAKPALRPREATEDDATVAHRILAGLSETIDGIDSHSDALRDGHVLDALVAAYTGWLGPDGLEAPTAGFNQASGWIWLPRV